MRRQLSGVVAIGGTVLVLCALAAAGVFGVTALSRSALRTGLNSAPAKTSTVRVSALYDAQRDRPSGSDLGQTLTHAMDPLDTDVVRTLKSSTYDLPGGIGARTSENAVFWSVRGAASQMRLVSGKWPRTVDTAGTVVPVAVPVAVAHHFGLRIGTEFTGTSRLNGRHVQVRVVGVWTARPYTTGPAGSGSADAGPDAGLAAGFGRTGDHGSGWARQPLVARGHTGDADFSTWGPFLVAAAQFHQVGSSGTVDWRAAPHWSTVTPAMLDRLRAQASQLTDRIKAVVADRVHPETVAIHDPLPHLLSRQARGLTVFRSLLLVPAALLGALAVCGLLLAATLLAAARRAEEGLLRSRGASPAQLVRPSATEAVVLGILGAALGPLLTAAAFTLAGRAHWPASAAWVASGLTGLVCAVVLTVPSAVRALRRSRQQAPEEGGHLSRLALGLRLAGLLMVVALGVVAATQLLRYGVSAQAGGSLTIDPLLVAAPAVVLVAATVVVELIAVPLVRGVARLSARRPSLPLLLGSNAVARDVSKSLPLALLVALAAGSSAFAVEQVASQRSARQARAAYVTGGDVRVTAAPVARSREPYAAWRALSDVHGVSAAIPVYRSTDFMRNLEVHTVAVDIAHLDGTALAAAPADGGLPRAMRDRLRSRPWADAPLVSANAVSSLQVHTSVGTIDDTTPLLTDSDGMPYAVGSQQQVSASGSGVHLGALRVTVDTARVCHGRHPPRNGSVRLVGRLEAVAHFRPCGQSPVHDLVLVFAPKPNTEEPIPAVVTDDVAHHLGVRAGDTFQQTAFGVTMRFRVVGVRPYLATLDPDVGGVLVDAAALVPRLVRAGYDTLPQQWWLTVPDHDNTAPSTVAADVSRLPGVGADVTTRADVRRHLAHSSAAGGTGVVTVLRVAAAAAVVLAALVLMAATLLRRWERRQQASVLRALGAGQRAVLAALGWEYLLTALAGSLGGFGTGTFVLWVMLGPLTLGPSGHALVPPASLVVPPAAVAVLLGVLTVVPALVVLLITRHDRRSGLAAVLRQEQAR